MPVAPALLVGCVRPLTGALAAIARQLVDIPSPAADSPIGVHLSSALNVPSYAEFPIVREALVAAMFATLSGVDHATAWCDLVWGRTATVSLATVARGAIEGLAKAHYVMGDTDTKDLVARYLAVTAADMVHPLRHSQFRDYTGKLLENETLPEVHQRIAAELELDPLAKPSVQRMVQGLLTAGTIEGHQAGPEIYSQLSGPAHAAMSALGMYVVPGQSEFALPDEVVTEQAGFLFAGLCVTAEMWLGLFGVGPRGRAPWKRARSQAEFELTRLIVL